MAKTLTTARLFTLAGNLDFSCFDDQFSERFAQGLSNGIGRIQIGSAFATL
jgi:hypothetical protein